MLDFAFILSHSGTLGMVSQYTVGSLDLYLAISPLYITVNPFIMFVVKSREWSLLFI